MTPEKKAYKRDVIIEVTTNLMFPLTLLFGMYVMFGTGGTGGGFQRWNNTCSSLYSLHNRLWP